MISNNFYLHTFIRVFIIVVCAIGFVYYLLEETYIISALFFVGIIATAVSLVYIFNTTNQKLARFFLSVKSEDFSLKFPENSNIKSIRNLNKSLNSLNDIVQKAHLDNQLKERYYQEIINQVNIGIMTFNDKGHILFANPKIEELLNYKPLNNIKQLLQVDEKLYETLKNPELRKTKLIQLTNEREKKQIAIKATSIILQEQELLLVVAQDIESELSKKEVDSWTRLFRVLTHEIMNTITPITSISQSILKYYKTPENVSLEEHIDTTKIENTVRGLEIIGEQSINLMEFVQSYRSLFSIPKPNKTFIRVEELLEKIAVLMRQEEINMKIIFDKEGITSDLKIFADEKQISQVLINLVKNAIDSLKEVEEGEVILRAGITNQEVPFVKITDNGPGIVLEIMDEIFIPFFTTKNGGTGIGLSLSKHIMHLHGGNLTVTSIPNEETTFMLLF
nr:ATP-binding protein [Tenacibaculum mesophilum]